MNFFFNQHRIEEENNMNIRNSRLLTEICIGVYWYVIIDG